MKKVFVVNGDDKGSFNGLSVLKDSKGIYWISDEYGTRRATKKDLKDLNLKGEHYE